MHASEEPLGVMFGPDQVTNRPELAIKIARIANAWAVLEASAGTCLGVLMRAEPKAAIAMLSKVQTATAKSQAIREVGKAVLAEADFVQLKELFRRFDALAKPRNDVMHGLWGTTPEWPEHLIRAPADVTTNTILGLMDEHLTGKGDEFLEQQKKRFEVWTADRFDELFSDILALIGDLGRFVAHQRMATAMSSMARR